MGTDSDVHTPKHPGLDALDRRAAQIYDRVFNEGIENVPDDVRTEYYLNIQSKAMTNLQQAMEVGIYDQTKAIVDAITAGQRRGVRQILAAVTLPGSAGAFLGVAVKMLWFNSSS